MAWPPPVLPINRTDATVQQATHPADHNAVNLAVNDTVARVAGIGDPWRNPQTVSANIPGAALSGSAQDIALTGVAGALATYGLIGGHPGITFNRAGVINGIFHLSMQAPAAAGGVIITTVYAGLYATANQLIIAAGLPLEVDIPLAENVAAGQGIWWQAIGVATAQTMLGGSIRIWESGPFGNNLRA